MKKKIGVSWITSALIGAALLLGVCVSPGQAQYVALQASRASGTIAANGEAITLLAMPSDGVTSNISGFGVVKIQTLDTYSGTWEVQCSVDRITYDADSELLLVKADSSTAVTSVTDTVGIWTVQNAGGCQGIRVIATAGFAATDVAVAIEATQVGGGGGGGGAASSVTVSQGGNDATVSVGGELAVTCAGCSGSGVSHVDDAVFTPATDDVVPVAGVFDDVTPDSVNEGDAGAIRMSANRNAYTTVRDAAGNERGLNVDANGDIGVTLESQATDIAVSNAGTFATQIDGAALTSLQIIDNVVFGAGTEAAAQRVTIATDSTGVISVDDNGASLTIDGTVTTTSDDQQADDDSIAYSFTSPVVNALVYCDNGSAWERCGSVNSLKRYISVGTTEDESEVKATAGVLVSVSARNAHASANAYLKCTNATAASTTPGTTAIVYEMLIPPGSGFVDTDIDYAFSTALTCYLVLSPANAAVDEVAADNVSYNLRYR